MVLLHFERVSNSLNFSCGKSKNGIVWKRVSNADICSKLIAIVVKCEMNDNRIELWDRNYPSQSKITKFLPEVMSSNSPVE